MSYLVITVKIQKKTGVGNCSHSTVVYLYFYVIVYFKLRIVYITCYTDGQLLCYVMF